MTLIISFGVLTSYEFKYKYELTPRNFVEENVSVEFKESISVSW
jgi:hypothetical protein